jgi:hypothetical protein
VNPFEALARTEVHHHGTEDLAQQHQPLPLPPPRSPERSEDRNLMKTILTDSQDRQDSAPTLTNQLPLQEPEPGRVSISPPRPSYRSLSSLGLVGATGHLSPLHSLPTPLCPPSPPTRDQPCPASPTGILDHPNFNLNPILVCHVDLNHSPAKGSAILGARPIPDPQRVDDTIIYCTPCPLADILAHIQPVSHIATISTPLDSIQGSSSAIGELPNDKSQGGTSDIPCQLLHGDSLMEDHANSRPPFYSQSLL